MEEKVDDLISCLGRHAQCTGTELECYKLLTKLRQTSITLLFFCREASAVTQVLSWTIPVEVIEAFLSGAMTGSTI